MPKLYQIHHILNLENRKGVYFAWVESHLRYGIELYGFTSEDNINRLQKIQNKIIKILFKNNDVQPTNELYKELKILNIKGLRNYVVLLKNYFNVFNSIDKTVLNSRRVSLHLKAPLWRNLYGKRHTDFYIPELFNTLPKEMWFLPSFNNVKKSLHNWLLK